MSTWLANIFGWREACFTWAALHLLVGLPLNALLPKATLVPQASPAPAAGADAPATVDPDDEAPSRRSMAILSFVFAATWFISTAMAAHLPLLMQAAGATAATALLVGMLIGPAQVAAHLLEFGWLRKVHPLLSARLASAMHPIGVGVLLLGGPVFAPLFGVLHGAGNGILAIAKGTLPLALFGSAGYGARQGWLMIPARVAQATAPFVFGVVLERLQAGALWVTAGIGLVAFGALLALRAQAPAKGPAILPEGASR